MEEDHNIFQSAYDARKSISALKESEIDEILEAIAEEMERRMYHIISENEKDLQLMDKSNPKYDRLMLTEDRIKGIVADIRNVIKLKSPIGKILSEKMHVNGMRIRKEVVPFGVIGIIFEARPNVCFDVFSLCFKTKNVCILKGGSDAHFSNEAIIGLIREVLDEYNVNPNVCNLLPNGRETTNELLKARDYVDLIIPRGGKALIDFVRENSTIPVIETGAGVCHTYFNKFGDKKKGRDIITNAKTRRVSVCNALDCVIIDKDRIEDLSYLCEQLIEKEVIIYGDKPALESLRQSYPNHLLKSAEAEIYGTEFLDYKMAIKTVMDINEALDHIEKYGSKHSECIVSENSDCIELFENMVDAACVYVNVSTAFTDGAQYGLGAEIGISTQKMHARGPMGLEEICSYKWIVEGEGQIRG
ncbi:MAG: glutamate-5-semialdehyde dehydrogenase [Dysgonomonas sp.]